MRRRVALVLALLLAPLVALAQRTGGSFGGSRWGSGAPASRPAPRVTMPVVRPATRPVFSAARPVYRAAPVDRGPVMRSMGRPVADTHAGVLIVPIGSVESGDEVAVPTTPSEPWGPDEWRAFAGLVAVLCVVGIGAWWVRRWAR